MYLIMIFIDQLNYDIDELTSTSSTSKMERPHNKKNNDKLTFNIGSPRTQNFAFQN